jgi:nucleoside-diphosphate-sugar epimerase
VRSVVADGVDTSNQKFRNMLEGRYKEKLAPNGGYVWVDVRDVAEAHVAAFEKPEAGGKRFFLVEGSYFSMLPDTFGVRDAD